MPPPETKTGWFRIPVLTPQRMWTALAIAVCADAVQFLTGPFGWLGLDAGIDVVAMLATAWLLGFHWLLLPTFAVEFIPLAGMLPTWTACVGAVIALRKGVASKFDETPRLLSDSSASEPPKLRSPRPPTSTGDHNE